MFCINSHQEHFKGKNEVPAWCQQFTTPEDVFTSVPEIRELMGWATLANNEEKVGVQIMDPSG